MWGQGRHPRPSLRMQCQGSSQAQVSSLSVATDRNTNQTNLNENGEREEGRGLRLKCPKTQRSGLLFMSSAAVGDNYNFELGLEFCFVPSFQHPLSCLIFGRVRNNTVIIAHAFVPLATCHALSRDICPRNNLLSQVVVVLSPFWRGQGRGR